MCLTNYCQKIHELSTYCFFLIYNVSNRNPPKNHENKIQSPKCTCKFDEYLRRLTFPVYQGGPWMTSKDVFKSKRVNYYLTLLCFLY